MLDPHLEGVVTPLVSVLRAAAAAASRSSPPACDVAPVQRAARLLHLLCTVRGHKTVLRFFSHEAGELEQALALLASVTAAASSPDGDDDGAGGGPWHARCVALRWLSLLALVPFALSTLDSGGASPLAAQLKDAGMRHLREAGPAREAAAELLARLLTRPDAGPDTSAFVAWCIARLDGGGGGEASGGDAAAAAAAAQEVAFLVPGAAAALAGVLKHGTRASLGVPAACAVAAAAARLAGGSGAVSQPLRRKLAVKLASRSGALLLPPRLAAWRYSRGARELGASLPGGEAARGVAAAFASGVVVAASPPPLSPQTAALTQPDAPDGGDDCDVPEEMDGIFATLLASLGDSDTLVRWAAAKGVGRLAPRLPSSMASQLVDALCGSMAPGSGEGAWHGGCLALGELARRGALVPEQLPRVAPLLATALRYDVRRGPHSVGAPVRDAACYCVWAASRAFAPPHLAALASALAPELVALACLDREVNCRRAAAAALQEAVGRLGGGGGSAVPHGIQLVALADYFSLGSRSFAYVTVAPACAALDGRYARALQSALLTAKVCHWDPSIRRLASASVGALAQLDPSWAVATAGPAAVRGCASSDPGARSGSLLALARLVDALPSSALLGASLATDAASAVGVLEKARLYRGRGGEGVRAAAAELLGAVASAGLPRSVAEAGAMLRSAEESAANAAPEVRAAAAAALGAIVSAYFPTPDESSLAAAAAPASTDINASCGAASGARETGASVARRLAAALRGDPNPAARRGAGTCLASCPRSALAPAWEDVAGAAVAACAPEADAPSRDAEARVAAVTALAHLLATVGCCDDDGGAGATAAGGDATTTPAAACGTQTLAAAAPNRFAIPASFVAETHIPTLCGCCDDYCTDSRGDVGSWVRVAAMGSLPPAVASLAAAYPARVTTPLLVAVAACMLKQAAEKIDRVRCAAADALASLLDALFAVQFEHRLPHAASLRRAFPAPGCGASFLSPAQAFPALCALLSSPSFAPSLSSGLLVSVGGLADGLGRAAAAALEAVCERDASIAPTVAAAACAALAPHTSGRGGCGGGADEALLATPALRTLDVLLCRCGLAAARHAPSHAAALAAAVATAVGCRDVPRLLAAASLAGALAGVEGPVSAPGAGATTPPGAPPPVRLGALRLLACLLACPYPRVRRAAAEAAYLRLLAAADDESSLCDKSWGDVDAATDILTNTSWDADDATVWAAVEGLHAALMLGPAAKPAVRARRVPPKPGATNGAAESYASLVESAGY